MRRKWSTWSRISDASVAPEAHLARRAKVQVSGQPDARRRRRISARPVAHQDRLDRMASGVRKSA